MRYPSGLLVIDFGMMAAPEAAIFRR